MIRLLTATLLVASFSVVADVTLTDINNNEVADAEVVMGNFNALKQGVEANATAIDALPTPPSDCLTNQIIKWNGSAWVCATDSLAGLSCEEGQTITYRNGAWQCAGCVAPGVLITDGNFYAAITDWFADGNNSVYGPISQWCTGNVTNMREAFFNEFNFNEDISAWDTSNVTDMNTMFYAANAFNQDISDWDTSKVTDMGAMFDSATAFNQDLSKWDASSLQYCDGFALFATAWLDAYGVPFINKTPPLSTTLISAGCRGATAQATTNSWPGGQGAVSSLFEEVIGLTSSSYCYSSNPDSCYLVVEGVTDHSNCSVHTETGVGASPVVESSTDWVLLSSTSLLAVGQKLYVSIDCPQ